MNEAILFSVIIPSYNRTGPLRRCLDCLIELNFPPEKFEVLVIDDGSTESYQQIQESYPNVNWFRVENGGPAKARNFGACQAKGKYLAFTDDDCYVHPDWLLEFHTVLCEHEEALVGGETPTFEGANNYDQVSQFINKLVYCHYNSNPEESEFFASNNMALSAELFHRIGGFCTLHTRNAAEDRTFCNLLLSLGIPLLWNRRAVVYHHPQLDFQKFSKMYFRYGRGAWTYQKSRRRGNMFIEASFHLNLPGNVVRNLKKEPGLARLRTLGLLLIWQVSNLAGFLWQRQKGEVF